MQAVVTDMSVRLRGNPRVYQVPQCQRSQEVSGIEVQRFSHVCKNEQRLMIIELGRYNSAEELLIGPPNVGSRGWAHSRDTGRRVSVTMVAVCMKEMGDGATGQI